MSSKFWSVTFSTTSKLIFKRLTISLHHITFNICNSSKVAALSLACKFVAVHLLLEKTLSQGTEDAWLGRMSSAMWAKVGYSLALVCNYTSIQQWNGRSWIYILTTTQQYLYHTSHPLAHPSNITAAWSALPHEHPLRGVWADACQNCAGMNAVDWNQLGWQERLVWGVVGDFPSIHLPNITPHFNIKYKRKDINSLQLQWPPTLPRANSWHLNFPLHILQVVHLLLPMRFWYSPT